MSYISREKLIDLILMNEDVWYGDDGKIYANVSQPAENVTSSLGASPYESAKRPKGSVESQIPIISAPEAAAAGTTAGDKQSAQIIISSQLFAEFGILTSRIYLKGKNALYNDSNKKEIEDVAKAAQELFGPAAGEKRIIKTAPRFTPDTPIEEVFAVIDDTPDELAKIYKIRVDELVDITSIKDETGDEKPVTWPLLLKPSPDTKKNPALAKRFPEGFNPILMSRVVDICDSKGLSGAADNIYKDVFDHLKEVFLSNKYKRPIDYAKYLRSNEQVKHKLENGPLARYWNKVMSSQKVTSVGQVADYLGKLISSSASPDKVSGNASRVLHWKLAQRLPEIKQYLNSFPSFLKHLKNSAPFRYEDILKNFNLSEEELYQFSTFAEFAKYVYQNPELVYELYQRASVKDSGRAKGSVRQGISMGVEARALRKQLENARSGRGRKGASVAQKRERMEELRVDIEARKEDIAELKAKLKTADPDEAAEIKASIEEMALQNFKDGKTIAALKLQIKKAIAANPDAEHEDADDKQERHTRELEDKLHDLINKRLSDIDDPAAIEDFLDRNDKSGEHRKRMELGSDYGAERVVTKFTVTVPASVVRSNAKLKDQLTAHFTKRANAFSKKLNSEETARGKEALTDVYCDAMDGRDGGMKVLVEIEYPEKSVTAKQIKTKVYDLIDSMLKPFPKEAGIKASRPEIGVQ